MSHNKENRISGKTPSEETFRPEAADAPGKEGHIPAKTESAAKAGRKRTVFFVLVIAFAAAIAALEIFPPAYSADPLIQDMMKVTVTRLIGAALFIPIMLTRKYKILGFAKENRAFALLVTLPALAVVVNNLPVIGLISGGAAVTRKGLYLALYALESISIGLFEEVAFRGVLFMSVLEDRRSTSREIFGATLVTSLVFGAVHLLNLFIGASPLSVMLQVGYSFLIGGMCAIVLLRTHSVWICVFLHSLFDFNGNLVPKLGEGKIWDAATVAITAVLGVAVLVFMLAVLKNTRPSDVAGIFPDIPPEPDGDGGKPE